MFDILALLLGSMICYYIDLMHRVQVFHIKQNLMFHFESALALQHVLQILKRLANHFPCLKNPLLSVNCPGIQQVSDNSFYEYVLRFYTIIPLAPCHSLKGYHPKGC